MESLTSFLFVKYLSKRAHASTVTPKFAFPARPCVYAKKARPDGLLLFIPCPNRLDPSL